MTAKKRRASRARIVAGAVLTVLLLLLFGLGAVLVNVMRPPGAPKPGSLGGRVTWVRSIYGFGPRAEQQLFEPVSVAVDGQGRIYVGEPSRKRISVYKRDGSFDGLITLMKSHDISLGRPAGMDLDDAGNLYVADQAQQKIIVFGPDKQYRRSFQTPNEVAGVTVRGDRLYAVGRGSVMVYNLNGELITEFGQRGREPGRLDGGYAVAVGDDGLLYVVDSFNKRVNVYKPNGDYVRAIGNPTGTSTASSSTASADASQPVFQLPTGLVLDGAGRLVSVDAFQFGMSVFTTSGKVVDTFGDPGADDGKFIYPSGLAYDKAGDLFVVADTRNNRVQVLRIAGSGRRRLDRILPLAFFQPVCWGPLALLILAAGLTVLVSRRGKAGAPAQEPSPGADEAAPEAEGIRTEIRD